MDTRSRNALHPRTHRTRHPKRYEYNTLHPGRSVITAAALDLIEHIAAVTWKVPGQNCDACGIELRIANTAYMLTDGHAEVYRTCYACGEAIMLHLGWTTPETAPDRRPDMATRENHPTSPPDDTEPWWPLPDPPKTDPPAR